MIATMHETETEATTAATTATLLLRNIHFADNDLSRVRYPTLINYPDALDSQIQADLGVQVGTSQDALEITFELLQDGGVSFVLEDLPGILEQVKCRDLSDPENPSPAGARAVLTGTNPPRCTFTWNRQEGMARVRAFRIYCRKDGAGELSARETVYGGLFLALIDQPRLVIPGRWTPSTEPVESLAKLKLIGIDDQGRPLYNIFQDYSTIISPDDADLEIEPTYRIYERQELRFDFKLALGPQWTFNRQLAFLEPPSARSLFAFTFPQENFCRFSWTRKDTGLESSQTGSASTFHLGVNPGNLSMEARRSLKKALKALHVKIDDQLDEVTLKKTLKLVFSRFESLVDPTVIEPPRCTNGICVG